MIFRQRERGFSLIELMMVLCISSILLRVALPAYAAVQRNARASQVQGDFNVIRAAAFAQFVATGSFAAEAKKGAIPAGMKPYLPKKFSFKKPTYTLDWDHVSVSNGGRVVALTVVVPDRKLGLTVLHTLGANCSHWSAGKAHTFVIESTLESPH